MAYDARNLYTMAYGGGFTVWYYRCREPLAQVALPGYFAPASRLLRSGDRLFVNCENQGCITAQDFVVAKPSTGPLRLLAPARAVVVPCHDATAAATDAAAMAAGG